MKISASLVLFAAALLTQPAFAQKWVVYSPPERDFRVLFPSDPVQAKAGDGAISFRALYDDAGAGNIEYVVHRLPAGVQLTGQEEQDIQRLLEARLGDVRVGRPPQQELDADWPRHVFEYRRSLSVNRVVTAGGRNYHLEVVMPRNRVQQGMQTARDFLTSFQAGGVSVPGALTGFTQKIETWCQGRTDVFTRTFCEYSTCLQPGFQQNPKCAGLLRR
jgi:hypothetical protein